MAKREPYLVGDKYTLDVDPDDEVNYVADVSQWLIDSATSVASFETVVDGVTVLEKDVPQGVLGELLPVKLKVAGLGFEPQPFCTFRVTTVDDQQFDRTMWFNLVTN